MKRALGPNPPEVVCLGEILIDMIARPQGRGLAGAEAFEPHPGGAPANVAVGLARLERASAFVGMVGRDAFGDLLRETLQNEGVCVESLATSRNEQPTTLAFVALDGKGVPSFVFYRHPGADQCLEPDDVEASVFEKARVFHFGSLSLMEEPVRDATFWGLEIARGLGMLVSYDPNYRPALWPSPEEARHRMRDPLGEVDLLKVSESELQLLSAEKDLAAGCAALADEGPQIIVVTRGERGAVGWRDGQIIEIPGEPIQAADTTGCGDAFMAGLLARLLEKNLIRRRRDEDSPALPISTAAFEDALRFANACGARAALKSGAISSLPKRSELPA
jgi:fructokinase